MGPHRRTLGALILGAMLGALILGIIGRVAMVGVALITENDLNLSLKGVLAVILVGTIVGAIGGLVLLVLRKLLPVGKQFRGILLGILLFGFSLTAMVTWNGLPFSLRSPGWLTLAVVAVVYTLYGIALDLVMNWLYAGGKGGPRPRAELNR